jgi:hypothetical protein
LPKSAISYLTTSNHRTDHFEHKEHKDQNHENCNFG